MVRLRPALAGSLAWTAGAVSAIVVGLLALSLIRTGLGDEAFQPPGSGVAVQSDPEPSATPTTEPTAAPRATTPGPARTEPAVTERTITTTGGTAVATCRGATAYLAFWTPAPGFRAEDVNRGPAPAVRLAFEGLGREIKISVRCVGGVPQPTVDEEYGDNGPGHE
jgi:hypothetical protein